MRVIVAGSRTLDAYDLVRQHLDTLIGGRDDVEIVSGGARGADALGERYARERGLTLTIMRADWETNGKAAGPIRNRRMAEYGTHLVAFWDGESRGTANMIEEARRRGLQTMVVRFQTH